MRLQKSLVEQAQLIREEAISKIRVRPDVEGDIEEKSKARSNRVRRIRGTILGILLIMIGGYVTLIAVFEVIEDFPLVTDEELYSEAFQSTQDIIVKDYLPIYGRFVLTLGISPILGAGLFIRKVFQKEKSNLRVGLHTTNNIVAATLLGGPLAGGYLISRNFKILSNDDAGEHSLLVAIITTAFIFGNCLFLLPEDFPLISIPILSAAIVYYIVRSYQGQQIKAHLEKGDEQAPVWKALAVGLIALLLSLQFAVLVEGLVLLLLG